MTDHAVPRPTPSSTVRTYLPEHRKGVPLVAVHGRSRHAGDQFRAFLPSAMKHDQVLVAPLFASKAFPAYQQLHGANGDWAAADALVEIMRRLREQHDLTDAQFDLVGYSGGAQFAHRFALRHPELVRRLVIVSAGWYTRLDASQPYPYGIADPHSREPAFDVDAFLALPMLVMVGDRDTERDEGLRTSARLDRHGKDRLQRALRWVDHLEEEGQRRGIATSVSFDVLPDCGHSFREAIAASLADRTVAYLRQDFTTSESPTIAELPTDSAERDA